MKKRSIYMSDTNPLNPYGMNYIDHSYESKIIYKFNTLKRYVHLKEEDELRISYGSISFFGGIFLAALLSAGVCKFTYEGPIKKYTPYIYDLIKPKGYIYAGIIVGLSAAYAYGELTTVYTNYICRPLMLKYLDSAIKNGFEDYEIS